MASDSVKGQKKITSSNTMYNAIEYMVRRVISEMVETADIVSVDSADQSGDSGPGGYASATPLVCQTDGFGNAIPSTSIPRMPFYRPQAGKAAIIMDPQPGDKGIAIYPKRDSSGITTGPNVPKQPLSFRSFSQADGVILNGILGEAPEIWLHLNPVSGDISLSTKSANVDISCRDEGNIVVKTGQGNITIQAGDDGAGDVTIDGRLLVTRTIQVLNRDSENPSEFTGGFENTGGVVRSNGVTLETHTHSGIERGDANTDSPNSGT